MKIVNSVLVILLALSFLSCKEKKIKNKIFKKELVYNSDSIYYNIDVVWNENGLDEELFLVTKNISVADSIFGCYNNKENWKRAWNFMKEKYPKSQCPNFTYNIHINENGKFHEFASIVYDARDITYPILRQGEFSNSNSNILKSKNNQIETSNFLRIMEVNNDNLDSKSMNVVYKNMKWNIVSKEIINHNYKLEYCIDTSENNFSLKKMNFHYIFDYPQSNFKCK
jgi:hypothetical protein